LKAAAGAMFIVSLRYLRPLDEIDAVMAAHVSWLKRQYAEGRFIASGRKLPRRGGIILARSGDRSALEKALAGDPFIAQGLASFTITEFRPSMTAVGAEVLKSL
jgi:uncharacterized protein YciI